MLLVLKRTNVNFMIEEKHTLKVAGFKQKEQMWISWSGKTHS